MKSLRGLSAGSLVAIVLGVVVGCGNGELDPGVPKDVGYVPPPNSPNMGGTGKRPVLGATDKERKEGLAAAKAADAAAVANPPAKP